jgi:hypothetical protein
MVHRSLIAALAAIALLGCSRQREAPRAAAPNPPAASPVVSAEPALDPEPRESAAAESSTPVDRPAAPSAVAGHPADPTFVIPKGTNIRVRLAQTLDTRYSRPGSRFTATLDAPILVGDRVVVPKGTPFTGAILAAKRSGRLRGRARLEITLRSFRMQNVTYQLATAPDTRVSGSHKKRNLAFMGGGTAAGSGIGALAGGGAGALIGAGVGAVAGTTSAFITGRKNVNLPVETPLVFALRSSIAVRRS